MKTHLSLSSLTVLVMLIGSGCGVDAPDAVGPDPLAGPEDFVAELRGTSVVPPVTTKATGIASFHAEATPAELGAAFHIYFSLSATGLSGVTGAQMHFGTEGRNGEMTMSFCGAYGSGCASSDTLATGLIEPSRFRARGTMSIERLRQQMTDGSAYVVVFTKAHPEGEIRGQVRPN